MGSGLCETAWKTAGCGLSRTACASIWKFWWNSIALTDADRAIQGELSWRDWPRRGVPCCDYMITCCAGDARSAPGADGSSRHARVSCARSGELRSRSSCVGLPMSNRSASRLIVAGTPRSPAAPNTRGSWPGPSPVPNPGLRRVRQAMALGRSSCRRLPTLRSARVVRWTGRCCRCPRSARPP